MSFFFFGWEKEVGFMLSFQIDLFTNFSCLERHILYEFELFSFEKKILAKNM